MGKYDDDFDEADKAFDKKHKNTLAALKKMSSADWEKLIPQTADRKTYDALKKVVDEATAKNESQAKLISNIKALGSVAVSIAKKIPGLSGLPLG